jgi:ArsR family transcriptional regulator
MLFKSYEIFFGTLDNSNRLKIINLLRKGKKNVSEISKELKFNQTTVSHNLKRLEKCGFVKAEQKGKFRYYKLNESTIKPLMKLIDQHMSNYCVHLLKEIKGGKK